MSQVYFEENTAVVMVLTVLYYRSNIQTYIDTHSFIHVYLFTNHTGKLQLRTPNDHSHSHSHLFLLLMICGSCTSADTRVVVLKHRRRERIIGS